MGKRREVSNSLPTSSSCSCSCSKSRIEHDYKEGPRTSVSCIAPACFPSSSRNTLVKPGSCKMFISVLCLPTSSFSHDSFHQQKLITAGHRPENKSSNAVFDHALASTFR